MVMKAVSYLNRFGMKGPGSDMRNVSDIANMKTNKNPKSDINSFIVNCSGTFSKKMGVGR